jgi:hypothetical protein
VPDVPDTLTLKRNRDMVGRERDPWTRRVLLTLVGVLVVLGLLNLFGQRPTTSTAASSAASLEVYAPPRVRGGLFFMARFRIVAHQELKDATLVLDPGWLESMQVNSIEPSPVNEASRDGRLVLEYGHVPAGHNLVAFLEFQVNPTNVGRRSQDVDLYDGDRRLVHVEHSIAVYP